MMDMQTILTNAVNNRRQEELANSPQLLLGEIILKLEAVKNKNLPLFIDIMDKRPKGIDSWRGSYRELAIQTEELGSYQTDEVERRGNWGEEYKFKSIGKEKPTVADWIDVLKEAIGKIFVGYKGGDFIMSKNTPVWLAEYGYCNFKMDDNNYKSVYFIDVKEKKKRVYLITKIEEE